MIINEHSIRRKASRWLELGGSLTTSWGFYSHEEPEPEYPLDSNRD